MSSRKDPSSEVLLLNKPAIETNQAFTFQAFIQCHVKSPHQLRDQLGHFQQADVLPNTRPASHAEG
jgi:hypothetical protein